MKHATDTETTDRAQAWLPKNVDDDVDFDLMADWFTWCYEHYDPENHSLISVLGLGRLAQVLMDRLYDAEEQLKDVSNELEALQGFLNTTPSAIETRH